MESANLTAKLSDLKSSGGSATMEIPGWVVEIESLQNDSLSSRMKSFHLRPAKVAAALTTEQLKGWANNVSSCVTGLLEPLRVLEVDATLGVAMLRSEKPTAKQTEALYYEVLLKADRSSSLDRYCAYPKETKPREKVPFTVTHEVLGKFVEDVTG